MYANQKEIAGRMFNPFRVCAVQLTSMRIPTRPLPSQRQTSPHADSGACLFLSVIFLIVFLHRGPCRKFRNKGCDGHGADSFLNDDVDPAFERRHVANVSDKAPAFFFRAEGVPSKRF
jgi:hypothetical protein